MDANKLTDTDNKWENFFFILIVFALFKRFTTSLFRFLRIPFKIAFIYYILKYFGFYFSYIFDSLNNLSLGIIDWFYNKIINFLKFFYNNDNKNN